MLLEKKLTMSQKKAYQIMQGGEPFVLLDVRMPEEFAQGHIKGARLFLVDEITQKAVSVLPDKNALILTYCHSGMRAANAAKQLNIMGYTNVFSFGGIANGPYEIVTV